MLFGMLLIGHTLGDGKVDYKEFKTWATSCPMIEAHFLGKGFVGIQFDGC
jgi:hypothetical protein